MRFSHRYKLLKDLPAYKKGWEFKWSGNSQKFYPREVSKWEHDEGKPGIYLDMTHQGYTVEEIQDEEWFEPIGEIVEFIPEFPSKSDIKEFVYLDFECRLVDDVDECRAMNGLFADKKFQDDLYGFVKEKYEEFYKLN